jgi:predicted tellurium resistance membrane protein TerC
MVDAIFLQSPFQRAFLLAKGTSEIHLNISQLHEKSDKRSQFSQFSVVIVQIMLLDIIFSIDSVIAAIGMAREFIRLLVLWRSP